MRKEPSPQELDALADMLEQIADDLSEDVNTEDLKRHDWLRRIVLASDRIGNAVRYEALDWAKTNAD